MKNYSARFYKKLIKTYMQHRTEQRVNASVFLITFLLTGFWFLLEVSFFILCNKAYLFDFSHLTVDIKIPNSILPGIFYFLLAQIVVHIGFAVLVALFSISCIRFFAITKKYQDHMTLSLWILAIIIILLANQIYVPYSKFSELLNVFMPLILSKILFFMLLVILILCSWISVFTFRQYSLQAQHRKFFTLSRIIFFGALSVFFIFPIHKIENNKNILPNIILIGMDSLRPDFVAYFGREIETPNLDHFLSSASIFSNAITPLARTFPSWTAILTGQYPKHNGIRYNLAAQNRLDFKKTLPSILRLKGYQTFFATDETRFSNIDEAFGFDQVITPPIGLNDFLIGTFNDFPISNIIINTKLGKILFPYSYANRPAYITYQPSSFLTLIHERLKKRQQKPLFLVAHFCLTHFPYLWQNMPIEATTQVQLYTEAVKQVDQQVGEFLKMLQAEGLLDHAIVVMLSDHGEALELNGDRITEAELYLRKNETKPPHFYPESLDNEGMNQSFGHGTDVLGIPQYHSLLAFKLYGMKQLPHQMYNETVSLLDISPTLQNLLGFSRIQGDGASLLPLMNAKINHLPNRHLFLESDYTPTAIRTVFPQTRLVMLEGVRLFLIDPKTTRLIIKHSMGQMIIDSKQLADIYGDWILAMYPQINKQYIPILINLRTGSWTDDLNSEFARQSPAGQMLNVLQNFYQLTFKQVVHRV